jgi:hypothetical protein
MELSPSWEATGCEVIQELPKILWDPESLLTCEQEPSTNPYTEPNQYSPYHTIPWLYDPS